MNVRDLAHPLLAQITPEERSRQKAVIALRRALNTKVRPKNQDRFEQEGAPAFAAREGRQPQSPAEVQDALFESANYRLWSAMNRSAQEMIWTAVGEPIYRDMDRIKGEAERLSSAPDKKGAVILDPDFTPPAEVAGIDIHLQPGGFAQDLGPGDITTGALYESGGNIYVFGQGLAKTDSKAGAVMGYIKDHYPDFEPQRILELGCSAGAASCAYAAAFPDAEVNALDIGAAMLRYAHARAEALGVAVIFYQMSAAALKFDDDSFDLVVSHNLLHEIGRENRRAAFKEAMRVCRPGGLVVHQDVPTRFEPTLVGQVERAWDTTFNGEAFWSIYSGDDLVADMKAAGARDDLLRELRLPRVDGLGEWYVLVAQKA